MNAKRVVETLLEMQWTDIKPPRQTYGKEEDTQLAVRSPFTAWNLAVERGQHDPALWAVIKGSAFDSQYRKRFNPAD